MQLVIPSLPFLLENVLYRMIKSANARLPSHIWMADFRNAIANGYLPRYEADWAAFIYLFFAANFLKSREAFRARGRSFRGKPTLRVLDIGCGSGAATAGILDAMRQLKATRPGEFVVSDVRVLGVDINHRQLMLYDKILTTWLGHDNLGFRVTHSSALCDVADALTNGTGSWDVIVCSYVIAELNTAHRHSVISLLESARASGTFVLIIDYSGLRAGDVVSCARFPIGDTTYMCQFSWLHQLAPDSCPKYCVHTIPRRNAENRIPHILSAYFHCWQRHDMNALGALFDDDAIYEIGANRVLRGRVEITAYWRLNAELQQNVTWEIHNATRSGSLIIADWTCRFYRTDLKALCCVHGIMWLRCVKGIIKHLREEYSKNVFDVGEFQFRQ